jgi:hypothetical protein
MIRVTEIAAALCILAGPALAQVASTPQQQLNDKLTTIRVLRDRLVGIYGAERARCLAEKPGDEHNSCETARSQLSAINEIDRDIAALAARQR